MSVLLVIPARYESTRYPGKPLVTLTGATGERKTLIERAWLAAQSVAGVDRIVVATDDRRIEQAAQGLWRRSGHDVNRLPKWNGTLR
jgi:3-deoxy-manno-octulosonate cytidylyltransferase (CMP-KDO synthetase)